MPIIDNTKDLDNLSRWTLFFNDAIQEGKIKIIEELEEESEEIAMAVEILKKVSADEVKRAKYDSRLKWILEKTTILNEAERAKNLLDDAEQRAENERQRAENERQKAENERQRAEKAEVSLKQSIKKLADKLDIETIAVTFSLSVEEVKNILKQ